MTASASVNGAVIFSQFSIDEVASAGQLQSAAEASSTTNVAGVAVEPEPDGDVFAIHADGALSESFLRLNPGGGGASKLTDVVSIAQQLGAPYGSGMNLTGGFSFSPTANDLYFAENSYGAAGEASIIAIDAASGAASLVKRTTDLAGISDHSVMPDGTIIIAKTSPAITATLTAGTGIFTPKLAESDFIGASPGSSTLPPEAIAGDPVSGKSYVSAHGDRDLFEVDNFSAASPVATKLTQTELTGADLHDLAVDQYGNVYGLDVAANQILIIRSTDKAVFTFPLTQIAMALGRPAFSAVPWRGIASRVAGYAQTDLFLSSGDNTYGVVRVRFGAVPSSVTDWTMY